MPHPVNAAQIVGDGQMRRGADVGKAHGRAAHPVAVVEQIVGIIHMRVGALHRFAQDARIGRGAIDDPLAHPLMQQRGHHVAIEILVEPGRQPPDLRPPGSAAADQREFFHRLLEIFADRLRIDERDAPLRIGHHRRAARRVHVQKLVALRPGRFAHQIIADAFLAQQKPHLARKGTEGELIELPHAALCSAGAKICQRRKHRQRADFPTLYPMM
jgi:hypothetical protein